MAIHKNRITVALVSLIMIGSLLLGNHSSSFAKQSNHTKVTVELIGGKLDYDFPKDQVYNFGDIKVSDKTSKFTKLKNQTISDTRGTGEGYNLTASATPFVDKINPDKKLKPGTLKLTSPTSSEFIKTTNSGDGNGVINPGKSPIDGSSIQLLYAPVDAGMGSYTLTFDDKSLEFKINQSDAKRGSYESTLTFTLASGPSN